MESISFCTLANIVLILLRSCFHLSESLQVLFIHQCYLVENVGYDVGHQSHIEECVDVLSQVTEVDVTVTELVIEITKELDKLCYVYVFHVVVKVSTYIFEEAFATYSVRASVSALHLWLRVCSSSNSPLIRSKTVSLKSIYLMYGSSRFSLSSLKLLDDALCAEIDIVSWLCIFLYVLPGNNAIVFVVVDGSVPKETEAGVDYVLFHLTISLKASSIAKLRDVTPC